MADHRAERTVLVRAATWESDGVLSLVLVDPDGGALEPWDPGAHIDLTLPSGLIRQYSLCGEPGSTDSYRIAILREDAGRGGSREAHESALVGRSLAIRGPRNHFDLVDEPEYVLVAGGIGITPILAMARLLEREGKAWSLVYGGRTRSTMAFLDELDALAPKRVTVVPQDEDGLIDLASVLRDRADGCGIYCCGPEAMILAVEQAVSARQDLAFHCERFAASSQRSAADRATENQPFSVRLARQGIDLEVPADRTLLDVVRDVLPDYPFNCEEGYCGSCETAVVDGVPDHRDDLLSPDEQAANDVMMICVGRSCTPLLTLDL